jgi:hypothetical protein
MSDLNPYEESLAVDLAKANDRIKQLQQALKEQSSVSDRLAEANEKLTAERDDHWKSFVHWRKEADDRAEQLEQLVAINEAACADAKEAEAYAEELEVMNKNQEAMIRQADRRGDALEAKLAQAVDGLRVLIQHAHNCEKELTEELHHQDFCGESLPLTNARATLAEIEGEKT